MAPCQWWVRFARAVRRMVRAKRRSGCSDGSLSWRVLSSTLEGAAGANGSCGVSGGVSDGASGCSTGGLDGRGIFFERAPGAELAASADVSGW